MAIVNDPQEMKTRHAKVFEVKQVANGWLVTTMGYHDGVTLDCGHTYIADTIMKVQNLIGKLLRGEDVSQS